MTIMPIITAPDERLKRKSLPVPSVNDQFRKLMDDMLETMYHDGGVGLAAAQVGVLYNILIIDLQDDDDTPRDKGFYPLFIVNPQITTKSDKLVIATEGCLSVPGQRIDVSRAESTTIQFVDYNNKMQTLEADGWLARAIQHEMDHLDGKLLIDYLSSMKKDVVLRRLKKLKNNIL